MDLTINRSIVVRMDITNKCNLRCLHCTLVADRNYRGESYGDMPVELFTKIAAEVFPYAYTVALSCEAEPMMHPKFLDILDIARQYPGAGYQLTTNATLITEEKVQALFDSNITHINISIDGATPITFERLRIGGKFDKVERGIELIVNKKAALGRGYNEFPRLQINYTLMRSTLHELPGMVELCKKWGVYRLTVQHLYAIPVNNLANESLIHFQQESNSILEECKQKCILYGIIPTFPALFDTTKNELPPVETPKEKNLLNNNLQSKIKILDTIINTTKRSTIAILSAIQRRINVLNTFFMHKKLPTNLTCRAPWQMIRIRWDGTVYPCDLWQESPIGNLHTTSFNDLWNNDHYKKLRLSLSSQNILYSSCIHCIKANLVTTDDLEGKKISTALVHTPHNQ